MISTSHLYLYVGNFIYYTQRKDLYPMNKSTGARAVELVHDALLVLYNTPTKITERWGLKSPIIDVLVAGQQIPRKMGINFQVVLRNGLGVSLEVIDEKDAACGIRSGRAHGVSYLIEKVRVFYDDTISKIIRRIVQCINRTLNTMLRKDNSRRHWKMMGSKKMKYPFFRPSRTMVVPKFDHFGRSALISI